MSIKSWLRRHWDELMLIAGWVIGIYLIMKGLGLI